MNTSKVPAKHNRTAYERKTIQIKSRVAPSLKNAVIAYALEIGENESFVVRQAVRAYLWQHGASIPRAK